MPTRSILGLQYVIRGLREQGENVDSILQHYGLNLDRMDPGARISRSLELAIHIAIAEILCDPLAGLRTGTYFGFAGYGPLTMLLVTAEHLLQAIQSGITYQGLTFLFGELSFHPGPRESALVLTPLQLPPKAFRFRVDGEMTGTYKLLRDMQKTLNINIPLSRIEFPYPAPAEAARYHDFFDSDISFGSPVGRFWVANEYLQCRMPTADPTAQALYCKLCNEALAAARSDDGNLVEQVRQHIALFNDHFPDAPSVARALGMSERNLRLQLNRLGSSFRQLRDSQKRERAEQLLAKSQLSISSIAQQLGYAESAAFIHAFRRQTGMTPAAFRRQLASGLADDLTLTQT